MTPNINEDLRELVFRANLMLVEAGLVLGTFGNVSGVDREGGYFLIKPSGIPYDLLTPAQMVPVSLETGDGLSGTLRPSSDAPTHRELYRAFGCGGVAHSHSEAATVLAQVGRPIRCMGTTHADSFHGDVPVTRPLTRDEVAGEYERNTGLVIVEAFTGSGRSPDEIPAVLVAHHGPFTWGPDPLAAAETSQVLERLARMEIAGRLVAPEAEPPAPWLIERHYLRKHGKDAYYGQG